MDTPRASHRATQERRTRLSGRSGSGSARREPSPARSTSRRRPDRCFCMHACTATRCGRLRTPYEAPAQDGKGANAIITLIDVTTAGTNRRVIALVAEGKSLALGDFTGGTAVVPEEIAETTTTLGSDGALGINRSAGHLSSCSTWHLHWPSLERGTSSLVRAASGLTGDRGAPEPHGPRPTPSRRQPTASCPGRRRRRRDLATEHASKVVFGGTSVADTERLKAVAKRIVAAREQGERVVAVLSAMGDSTDDLVALAYEMSPRPSRASWTC